MRGVVGRGGGMDGEGGVGIGERGGRRGGMIGGLTLCSVLVLLSLCFLSIMNK